MSWKTWNKAYGDSEDGLILAISDPAYEWTEQDSKELVCDYGVEEIPEYGAMGRWTYPIRSICKVEGIEFGTRFYSIWWECGLTEYQENEFSSERPVEVRLEEKEKVVKVREWVDV